MHDQSKGPNDAHSELKADESMSKAPSPLQEPEQEMNKFQMICNDNSQFYMELENREDITSIGQTNGIKESFPHHNSTTEVIFTSIEKSQIKRSLPDMSSFHELCGKNDI